MGDANWILGNNYKKLLWWTFFIFLHFEFHLQEKWDKKICVFPLNVKWSKMILHIVCYHVYTHKNSVNPLLVENWAKQIVAPTVAEYCRLSVIVPCVRICLAKTLLTYLGNKKWQKISSQLAKMDCPAPLTPLRSSNCMEPLSLEVLLGLRPRPSGEGVSWWDPANEMKGTSPRQNSWTEKNYFESFVLKCVSKPFSIDFRVLFSILQLPK